MAANTPAHVRFAAVLTVSLCNRTRLVADAGIVAGVVASAGMMQLIT